jgi:hypothetical protein
MNIKEAIEKLQLGETVNRLLAAMINTENVASNLYIGTMEIATQGEPKLDQLKWIPRKVANLQKLTAKLHDSAGDFKQIAKLAEKAEKSTFKSLPVTSIRIDFHDVRHDFKQQLDYLSMVLQDMENAVNELDYPVKYFFQNLYEINEKGSQLIIKEQDKVEYKGRKTKIGMGHPMHYYFISVSESDGTAFVATGHQFGPLVGGGYHEIWGNIHKKPRMISSHCVWQS